MKRFLAVAAVAAAILCALLSGCYNGGTFEEVVFSWGADEITEVRLNFEDRAVKVVPSTDGGISFRGYKSQKEFYTDSVDGGVLTISLEYDKEWSDYLGGKPAEQFRAVELCIPVQFGALDITTTNEDVSVSGITLNSCALSSNGGSVEVEDCSAQNFHLYAKNGNITCSLAGAYEDYAISCTIKKGESNVASKEQGENSLSLNCNNGDITVNFLG